MATFECCLEIFKLKLLWNWSTWQMENYEMASQFNWKKIYICGWFCRIAVTVSRSFFLFWHWSDDGGQEAITKLMIYYIDLLLKFNSISFVKLYDRAVNRTNLGQPTNRPTDRPTTQLTDPPESTDQKGDPTHQKPNLNRLLSKSEE